MVRSRNPVKEVRASLARETSYKERTKILRKYDDRFAAAEGFDLRRPDSWTPAQKAAVTRTYKRIENIVDERERHDYDQDLLKERVKKIRPYFGDMFKPSEGYDLREMDEWHPSKKKKATRYFLAMAPDLAKPEKVVKRMRRPDRLEAMILRTDQTELLPGQTAAVFGKEQGRDLSVDMNRRGVITYTMEGQTENELDFNIAALQADPQKELERVLGQTDAQVFRTKLIVGKGYDVKDRDEIGIEVLRYMTDYTRRRPKEDVEKWDQFLKGLVAYPGETKAAVEKQSRAERLLSEQRQEVKAKKRAAAKRKWTVAETKAGRRLSTAEKARMRKGRKR